MSVSPVEKIWSSTYKSAIPVTSLALKLVAPRLTVPVAVRLDAPMLIFPNPLVILPEFSAPVPVIAAWCCVTLVCAIRASGTVPLDKLLALSAVRLVPIPPKPVVPLKLSVVVLTLKFTPGTLKLF